MQLLNVFIQKKLFMIIYRKFTARRVELKKQKKKRRQARALRKIMTMPKKILLASMKPFRVVDVLDMITVQVKANHDTITTMAECLLNLLVLGRAIKLFLRQMLGFFMS